MTHAAIVQACLVVRAREVEEAGNRVARDLRSTTGRELTLRVDDVGDDCGDPL
jgi:hypothetical protein